MPDCSSPARPTHRGWWLAFGAALAIHLTASLIGWSDQGLAGHEFRQSQTALSTYFILQEQNYHLAYPTPILGKPWAVPMEFPLYQWTVAKLCTWFHWPLVQTGRAVSLACFYLTLPAWFLLLRSAGLGVGRRLAVLLITLSCPIYIFYSRAFLIESMALLFASWHVWFVVSAFCNHRISWLVGAWITGSLAALIKITTWSAVLLPCTAYAVWQLWSALRHDRNRPRALRLAAWALGATLPALLIGVWWIRTADGIKAENPAAAFLSSHALSAFNFGAGAQRISWEFWKTLYQHWHTTLLPLPALLFTGIGIIFCRGALKKLVLLCLGGFIGSQLIFANLYALHSYYFFANGFLLSAAFALAGCQLLDRVAWPKWLRVGCWSLLPLAGFALYEQNFLGRQRIILPAGSGLTEAVQTFSTPNDVIVVFGDDWSSVIPFTTRRRALMVPSGTEDREQPWRTSLDRLRDEHIALLLVKGEARKLTDIVRRRADELGMQAEPLFSFQNTIDVYGRKDQMHAILGRLRGAHYSGVDVPRNEASPGGPQQFVPSRDRAAFFVMSPFPTVYRTPYDVPAWFEYENQPVFVAHAPTRLEFVVAPGVQTLRLRFGMIAEAYQLHRSDGVDVIVEAIVGPDSEREIWHYRLDPLNRPDDRAVKSMAIPLKLEPGTRLVIRTSPGPAGDPAFDWVYFSEITLR